MTVPTLESVAEFSTNGVTTNFPFFFKFLANEDLVVTYVSPAGISSVLTLGTQYAVNGAGDESGSIVTTTALAGPGQLIVSREIDAYQQTSLRNQGKFLAETHENVFDKLTMLIQQGFAIFKRALVRPFGRDYYDAESRNISFLADPVEPQDAATRGWTGTYVADLIANIQGPINNAANVFYQFPDGSSHVVQDLSGANGATGIGESRYGGSVGKVLNSLPYYASAAGLGQGGNDTVALQTLINNVSAAGGGQIVMDCNTDYLISNSIYVKSNIVLNFTGTGFLKLTASSGNGAVLVVYSQNPSIITENVHIINPRIDGGNFGWPTATSAAYGENGVAGTSCKHVRVYGGFVKNCRRGSSNPVGTGGKAIQFESGVDDILVEGLTAENCTILCETGGSPNDTQYRTGTRVTYKNLTGKNIERPISLMQLFTPPGDESVVSCLIDGVQLYNCGREGVAGTELNFGLIVADRYTGAVVRNVQCYNEPAYGKIHSVVRMRRGQRNEFSVTFNGACDYIVSHREPTGGGSSSVLQDNIFGPIRHSGICNTYAVGGASGDTAALLDNLYEIFTDTVTTGLIEPQIQTSTLFGAFTSGTKVQRIEGPFNLIGGYFANTYYSGAFGFAGSVNISGLSVAAVSGGYALDCPGDMFLRRSGSDRLRTTSVGVRLVAPTYADNATALAGGLVATDVYKTAAGDLRIVV